MKIRKWVNLGQEVEVDIDATDISVALAEAFAVVLPDPLGEERPSRNDILIALNGIAEFLNALTDDQIDELLFAQRNTVWASLCKAAERFRIAAGVE